MKFNWIILDGDPLVYRCGFAVEKLNKDTDILEIEPLSHAYYNIDSMINKCFRRLGTKDFKMWLTASNDKSNFRFNVFSMYKANRKDARKPVYYNELRQYLSEKWSAKTTFGQEADDACSIAHCEFNNLGWDSDIHNSVVCSFDKDFNNIPGWHYNYVTDDLYFVSELQAYRNFYLQILTGDSSDGIPRIKRGWRKKEVERMLSEVDDEKIMYNIVKSEIVDVLGATKMGLKESDIYNVLINRGRLVWLRREANEFWTSPCQENN